MKAFVVSLLIILAIFVSTVINCIYVNNVTSDLIEAALSIQIDDGSIQRFAALWEEKQFSIRMSSSHDETHKIDETLAILKSKEKEGDASGFCEERALLVEYLIQIQEDEVVSFDSII